MAITVLDLALAYGAKPDTDGSISGAQFVVRSLPILSGCQECGARLGPGNAYPSKTGYIRCHDCLGDLGYATTKDFETAKGEIEP